MTVIAIAIDKIITQTVAHDSCVRLDFKWWDLAGDANLCTLKLLRGGEEIVVDGKTATLDLRCSPVLDFGTAAGVGDRTVQNYLREQVKAYVSGLLKPLCFKLEVCESRFSHVWFTLKHTEGRLPDGLMLPYRFETSALSLLPAHTRESSSLEREAYLRLVCPNVAPQRRKRVA